MLLVLLMTIAVAGYAGLATVAAWAARSSETEGKDLPPPDDVLPPVSIIVAARNEADTLPQCLAALQAQDYPPGRLEFLIADDHSTDATPDLVKAAAQQDPRVHLVHVPPPTATDPTGKAHALHQAIQQASSDVLLLTDADCTPPPAWARHLAARLAAAPEAGVVCGVTVVAHRDLRSRLQALDWLLLLSVSAAAARLGLPLTAMGNNMGLRRQAYDAVGGYPALPFSVTEDHALFQAIRHTPPWSVHLMLDARLRNVTQPLPRLRDVFRQRRRWARGGLRAENWAYGLYGIVFLTHALLLAGLFIAPAAALPLLLVKSLADVGVLLQGALAIGIDPPWPAFPLYEGLLFGYVLAMPLALALSPRIAWKGRTH